MQRIKFAKMKMTNRNPEARETSMQAWLENITVDLKDLEVSGPLPDPQTF